MADTSSSTLTAPALDNRANGKAVAKLWLLTNSPSPYQLEFFRKLGARNDVELSLRFMNDDFRGDDCRTTLEELGSRTFRPIGLHRDELRVHPGAIREAIGQKFDVYVLSGLYTCPTIILLAILLKVWRRPYVLWLERPSAWNRRDLSWLKLLIRLPFAMVRSVFLRLLLFGSKHVIGIGRRAVEQYGGFGVSKTKMTSVPYCTDAERFTTVSDDEARKARVDLNVDGQFVFLFSGQLIHRKGVDTLVRAFEEVVRSVSDCVLLILGDGPLKGEISTGIAVDLQDRIRFLGHLEQDRLPATFASAHVFVFPTRHDGWGVVINEACAAGLAILSSQQAGAAFDLVTEGENGYLFDADDADRLSELMLKLAQDRSLSAEFGRKSRELSQLCSTSNGVDTFVDVIRNVAAL